MRHRFTIVALALCLAGPGANAADQASAVAPKPYLGATAEPDELAVLPAPPAETSPTAQDERDLFTATRTLKDTQRWTLAIEDANRDPVTVWADFGCALGGVIPADRVPAVIALLGRLDADVEASTRIPKIHYKRARPLVGNLAPLCVARTDKLTQSYSFPSGHATQGWATALVLAELVPDRATQVLQRGRVFGDSRIVCGVHWLSDVEAGRTAAAALVATLHGNADFRHDLDQARAEIATARAADPSAPDAAACRIETDAAATPLR